MSSPTKDAVMKIKEPVADLQQTQGQIKARTNVSNTKNAFADDIRRCEGIEKRLDKIEEIKNRNTTAAQSVLEILESLSGKVSITISQFTKGFKMAQETRIRTKEENPLHAVCINNDDSFFESNGSERTGRYRDGTHVNQVPTSEPYNEYNKFNAANGKLDSNFNNDRSPMSKILVRNLQKEHIRTTSDNPEYRKPDKRDNFKRKRYKTKLGYKLCLTKEDEDNRNCYDKQNCLEEETLNIHTPVLPTRNILVQKEKRLLLEHSFEDNKRHKDVMKMGPMNEEDDAFTHNVHSFEQWFHIATQSQREVALKMTSLFEKRSSHGHSYVILLDTSESMRGEKFDLMIKKTKEYIEELEMRSLMYNVRDEVGLACFGEETKLILPPLTDYNDIKKEIGKLKPRGPSPLAAGLLMALSGLTHCSSTTVEGHTFKPIIILMTDGIATRVEALNEEDRDTSGALVVSSFMALMAKDQEIDGAVKTIAAHGIQICCVPFGSANTDIMSKVVTQTFGRMIPNNQIHRLCRMTHTLCDASMIARKLETTNAVNTGLVKTAILDAGLQEYDKYDDITDTALVLLDPLSQYHGRFRQTRSRRLRLGTRVRRGPNWHWQNQDSNMAGTVIGEDRNGMIWVEWDSGHSNVYHYDENRRIYDIKVVNEPRRLVDDIIAVGCKVQRGTHWRFGDQDGGKGCIGTVLRVEPNGRVVVKWDRGSLGIYNFAYDGIYEVEVCENGRTLHSTNNRIEQEKDVKVRASQSDGPIILPSHKSKILKPITATWQYLTETGKWLSYDEETNVKIERAFSRNPNGKCIVEIDKTIYLVLFSKMTQENQSNKTSVPVQRTVDDELRNSSTLRCFMKLGTEQLKKEEQLAEIKNVERKDDNSLYQMTTRDH